MNFKEKKPLVVPVKFKDAPDKTVTDYFESKCHGIKLVKEPDWDRVPWTPAQGVLESYRELEASNAEFEASSGEQKERVDELQRRWRHLEQLELQLKNCFIETETKIKGLEKVTSAESEEKRADTMKEREKWLETRTSQLCRAKERIEDETERLKPYKDFVERVASSNPVYGGAGVVTGAEAVLNHYERLCDAQSELETRQSNALVQLHKLRTEAQNFTAEALSKLDAQQAHVAALKEQVKIESSLRDESNARLARLRTTSQMYDAEEGQLRAAISNLYEQLWRRYHPGHPQVPPRDIAGQANYVQHTLEALRTLVEHRKQEQPSASSSLQPQISDRK